MITNNLEKNCKWFFIDQKENSLVEGFQGIEAFFSQADRSAEWSFIREVIQNSTDARLDKTKPVHVKLSYGVLSKNNYPALFRLSEHVKACKSYNQFDNDICQKLIQILANDTISYLKVSDYNTTGLVDNAILKVVYALGMGKGADDKGAGGSFGCGHYSYIGLSPIRSFLISSYDKNSKWSFSGHTSLRSHTFNNQSLSSYGYYTSSSKGSAIVSKEEIPTVFRRNETEGFGTDLFVLGYTKSREHIKELIYATLANYWYAIYLGKLTFEIEEGINSVCITKENLENFLTCYFKECKGACYENPLPTYKAVKACTENGFKSVEGKYVYLEKEIEALGMVKLFININKADFNHRGVQFMRIPSMLISAERIGNIANNVSALFVCDNPKGDELLRRMESLSHTEWSTNFLHLTDKEKKKYKKLPTQIKQFVRDSILELYATDDISIINIDLGNMLNPFAGSSTSSVDSASQQKGKEKGKVKEKKETKRVQLPSKSVGSALAKEKGRGKGKTQGNGAAYRTADIEHPGHGYRHRNPVSGDGTGYEDIDRSQTGSIGKVIDVDFDLVAIARDDKIWHRLYLTSPKTYHDCSIYIDMGTDSTNDTKCEIAEINTTQKLTVKDNCINGIEFRKDSLMIIEVRFTDNLKHSLTIRSFRNE